MDADMKFAPDALARLARLDVPIASGLYFARADTPIPHAYRFARVVDGIKHYFPIGEELTRWFKEVQPDNVEFPDTHNFPPHVVEVDAIGFGCVLVAREVLERIGDPWFVSYATSGGGEDFDFCEKARAAGYTIHVDMGVQCEHELTNMFVGREDFSRYFGVGEPDEHDWSLPQYRVEIMPNGWKRRVGSEVDINVATR